jgi:hypothetical protein
LPGLSARVQPPGHITQQEEFGMSDEATYGEDALKDADITSGTEAGSRPDEGSTGDTGDGTGEGNAGEASDGVGADEQAS